MPVPFQYPQGRISLVNSSKKQGYLCPRQLLGYSCSAVEWPLFEEAVEVLVYRVGPGLAMLGLKTQNESISMHRFAASG